MDSSSFRNSISHSKRSLTSTYHHDHDQALEESKRDLFRFVSKQMVVPSTPPKQRLIPLTMLDRFMLPLYSPAYFIFNNIPGGGFPDFMDKLQKSLSQVLVPYFPLAGRLKANQSSNSWDVHCEDHDLGVEITVVSADDELRNTKFCKPCLELWHLVPRLDGRVREDGHAIPVMSVQVTKFRCGAIAIGCGIHHHCMDATAVSKFMLAWSEVARGKPLSSPPSHNRLAFYDISSITATVGPPPAAAVSAEKSGERNTTIEEDFGNSLIEGVVFRAEDVKKLKSKAPPGSTSFQVTTAMLVHHIMKVSPRLVAENDDRMASFMFMTDYRRQLSALNFAGNLALPMFVTESFDKVLCEPLTSLVETIKRSAKSADATYFKTMLQKASGVVKDTSTFPLLVVTSCAKLPFYEVDFGYGSACFAGFNPPGVPRVAPQMVLCLPSPNKSEDLVVYLQLPKDVLAALLRDQEFMSMVKLFRPLDISAVPCKT